MDGDKRRKRIIELLECKGEPLSGAVLSRNLGVSRQVIVQDIALLRATNKNILSTNKGYLIYGAPNNREVHRKVMAVCHDDLEMREELYIIVDEGARVLDVIVEHEVYGQISVDLLLSSRKDVDEFMEKIKKNPAKPLKELTDDVHYHTIEAETTDILSAVEDKLKAKQYLISMQ